MQLHVWCFCFVIISLLRIHHLTSTAFHVHRPSRLTPKPLPIPTRHPPFVLHATPSFIHPLIIIVSSYSYSWTIHQSINQSYLALIVVIIYHLQSSDVLARWFVIKSLRNIHMYISIMYQWFFHARSTARPPHLDLSFTFVPFALVLKTCAPALTHPTLAHYDSRLYCVGFFVPGLKYT